MHFYISGINFWCESLGRVTSKVGKSSVLQARNRSFVRRGFRRKVPFFISSTKLSEVVQDIAFDALAPDCGIQVLPNFSEVLSAVFMCNQLPGKGNRVFNQFHCLSKVCVPAKEELFFVGFLPSASQTHRGCVGKVLPFEAFFWHLLFGGSFPSFATISIASCSGS